MDIDSSQSGGALPTLRTYIVSQMVCKRSKEAERADDFTR